MIAHYSFGQMIPTDSVVQAISVSTGAVPFLQGDAACWRYTMGKSTVVYGLGEAMRGINKRGWLYTSLCSDEPHHTEDKHSLYAAHNFLLVDNGPERFGIFIDFGGTVCYDIGYTDPDVMTITLAEPNYDLYILTGASNAEICRALRGLTGRSYIPPRWAFGFGQSRWGYRNEADVRRIAKGYRDNGLPLDMIYLDIDYMQDYADFTVNKERFPDLKGLSAELKAQGIRLVPIIDAGIKKDENDRTCGEGLTNGYFCKKEDGTPFIGAVWPGLAYFADFMRPEVRRWFGGRYQSLLDQGIEGFWNDMNEPAIFYTPETLARVASQVAALHGKNVAVDEFFAMMGAVNRLCGDPEDYKAFYHEVDGQPVRHDRIHNLYGYNMTRAAGEAFQALRPGKRTLLFSRASCIGAHRYGGIWLGDNCSWWGHLLQNIKQMPSVQMCGFLYSGADLGGFDCNATGDLVLRWTEFALFCPLFRNHASNLARPQEFYQFSRQLPALRKMLKLRYALLPYLYSEYMKAALGDGLYFRPLAFDYPADETARGVEDQLLLGEGLMLAPVYTQNATGRYVYLPEQMKLLRLRGVEDYEECILPAGHHYLPCAEDELLLFIRPGHLVPLATPAQCTELLDVDRFAAQWSYLPQGKGEYLLYTDDGITTAYDTPAHWRKIQPE